MTDYEDCGRPVDGLFCAYFRPMPKRPPIDPAVRAKIEAALGKWRKPRDREAELERAAIQDEGW